jgi:hypothetical protein
MASVRLDRQELAVLLRGQNGPVVRDLLQRGFRVSNRARQNLRGARSPELKAFDTGALTNSIGQEFLMTGQDPMVRVGANTYYAVYVHEGTRRMTARPYLRDALNAAR